MFVENLQTKEKVEVRIARLERGEYKGITEARFWFDWKAERGFDVYKLCTRNTGDILGLMSLEVIPAESRIEIRLLAVSKENRGSTKVYDHITGNLIAFAGIQATKLFGDLACISLVPKTELIRHYMETYAMLQAGRSLFLDGRELLDLIAKYDHGQGEK
ncbi:MAG: N-acetyltransferase [Imperialibacter sp.]|uniref:N-acetyltransferase n=1 Tax=Imperialibacter sp. TaxID=2038411 RepID=UPI003A8A5496